VPPSASSTRPLRGRFWVLVWLALFLAVAVVVQARQSAAIATARRLAALREQVSALEAERAALQRRIHIATSRKVLGDRAERELGLMQPHDSQFTVLLFPTDRVRP
jgi:cell division protein FtsB